VHTTVSSGPRSARPTRKYLVLAICCMSLLIVSMDATIVNVALPSIRSDFHVTISNLQWTIDSYTLTLASFLLLSGSLADRFGRRRTFQVGLAIFVAGSLLCSIAPSIGFLIAARVLQGLGGSMLNPVAMSIITNTFTVAKERARAVGVWGAVVGISMAIGPLVGGALTETVGWRSVFWVNVPIGLAAIVLTALFVPESRAAIARRLDPAGQALAIVTLVSAIFALIEGPRLGWTSPVTLGLFVVAALAVVALILHEKRTPDPFIDLRFFHSFPFTSAALTAVLGSSSFGAFLFINALYLQGVRGFSPIQTGTFMVPLAAATLVLSLVSGRMVGSFGTRPSLLIAGVMMSASGLVMTTVTANTADWTLILAYVLFGIGFGAVNAPITTSAVSGMPRSRAGVASGVASTSRQTGVSLGVALAGTVTGAGLQTTLGPSFAIAAHAQWWVIVGAGAVIVVLGVISTSAWSKGTTRRIAELLDEPEPEKSPIVSEAA
jgi:EmrB/QacA subfamily drug resistance transporter